MARSNFGGTDSTALAVASPSLNGGLVKSAPNITGGTAWSAATGGTQYTDLIVPGGGATTVRTDANGYIQAMQGPDGVNEAMWVDLGSGTRFYLRTTDGLNATYVGRDAVIVPATFVRKLDLESFVYTFLDLGSGVALAGTFPNGSVYKTLDYGRTWTLKQVNAGGAATLHDLIRLRTTAICLGATDNGGKVTRSTDNGETWSNSASSVVVNGVLSNPKINCLIQLDNGVVLAGIYVNVASGGMVHRSTDGGLTWDAGRALGTARGVNIFLDLGSGIVLAGSQNSGDGLSEWWRSTDYGVTFTRMTSGLNVSAAEFGHCGVVLSPGVVVIGTYGGGSACHIYRSTDYGVTWATVATDAAAGFFTINKIRGSYLMASTGITEATAKIMESRDGGITWTDWQYFAGTGATHAFALVYLGSGIVLVGTGTTGQVWRTADASTLPPTFNGIILTGRNKTGSTKPAGTPVTLGGSLVPSGTDCDFYAAAGDGVLGTVGVLVDSVTNGSVGRIMVVGVATVNVQSATYVPGDVLRTYPDGLTAVVDNTLANNTKIGKVLSGGVGVTTVTALVNVG